MVLALPILTRLYSPADFGMLAVYAAVVGIISVIACLRYNIAIPLPESDADAFALLALSVLAASLVGLLCALPVVLAPAATASFLGKPELLPLLWMLPVGVTVAALYDALQYWASRKKRFALVSRTRVSRAIGGAGVQLGLGTVNPAPSGLLLGHMVYGGLGIIGLLRSILREDRHFIPTLSFRRMRQQAHAYLRFPTYSVPEALLNTAGTEVPVLVIAATVAGPEAGFLLLAMRVMGLPMGLVGSSVAQVYLSEAAGQLRNGRLATFTRRTMWSLFKTGAPIMFVAAIVSPFAFPILFGTDWGRAGWLVTWMAPWFLLQFIASPVSMVLHVIEEQHIAAALQAVGFVLRVGAVVISSNTQFVTEVFALSGACFYAIYLLVIGVRVASIR